MGKIREKGVNISLQARQRNILENGMTQPYLQAHKERYENKRRAVMKVSQLSTSKKKKENHLSAIVDGSMSLGAQALYIIIVNEFQKEPFCADVLVNFSTDSEALIREKLKELEAAKLITRHITKKNGKLGKLQFILSSSSKDLFSGSLVSKEESLKKLMSSLLKGNIYQLLKDLSSDTEEKELLGKALIKTQEQVDKARYQFERSTKESKESRKC